MGVAEFRTVGLGYERDPSIGDTMLFSSTTEASIRPSCATNTTLLKMPCGSRRILG